MHCESIHGDFGANDSVDYFATEPMRLILDNP